jgi:hypothetical protein
MLVRTGYVVALAAGEAYANGMVYNDDLLAFSFLRK